jgi:hypothetical protein
MTRRVRISPIQRWLVGTAAVEDTRAVSRIRVESLFLLAASEETNLKPAQSWIPKGLFLCRPTQSRREPVYHHDFILLFTVSAIRTQESK